ncbi:MAG: exodeoxyribonuclease VII large subunit [Parasporobacterium sp.]|nr:exodeoxyribonuclease VII large subunit [Parasporobacterium sp.]
MLEKNNVYTVAQINRYVRDMMDRDFLLKNVYIKGEISNCKYHYTGHVYFSVKDETSVISAVMFSQDAAKLTFRMKDGMKAVFYGRVSVFERDGRYQLYVKQVYPDGEGILYRRFEELKNRLRESGMFDEIYKKPIPRYSRKIGVVTSETGAVIRDIFNVASTRNPYCRIMLYPAKVQGEGAAASICEGIRYLDELGLDVIIIGRGGGSIEDLWAFNEESVARAIFEAKTPIISAVGHETDVTIADFAADQRASTPSQAAELAVFRYDRFTEDLNNYVFSLDQLMEQKLNRYMERSARYRLNLEVLSPGNQIHTKQQKLKAYETDLNSFMNDKLSWSRERLLSLSERLSGLSPLKRLREGYSYVTAEDGSVICRTDQAKEGDLVTITVSDGSISARVIRSGKQQEQYQD